MDCVESFSLFLAQVDLTHAQNLKPFIQDTLNDDSLFAEGDYVGLDDC
jgi:hypothetical protein